MKFGYRSFFNFFFVLPLPAGQAGPKGSQKWLVLNNFFVLPPTLKGAKKGLRSKYFFDLPRPPECGGSQKKEYIHKVELILNGLID